MFGLVALLCCATGGAARADGDYQLGHGLDLGPFNFAGYSNVVGSIPDQGQKSLAVDDLSLFVSGHLGQFFNPFTEAELSNFNVVSAGAPGRDPGDGHLLLERLYNDSYLTDATTLRLGKMLTPVGEWNVIHAAPLELTTVRPAVTDRNFAAYATGASVLYSDPYARLPDVQVYWQPSGEFAQRPDTITFHQYKTVEGAHVAVPLGLLDQVGFSFQQSKDIYGSDQSLYGLDFHYTLGRLTLQGEGTFSDINNNAVIHTRDTEWGAYAAASYALSEKWSVYGWYEEFADRAAPSVAHDVLAGIAYRPQPPIVLRLEYLQNISGTPVNPTGVFAGWAVLF